MKKFISVEDILHKHGVLGGCINESKAAIKEIIEAVIDKCAEKAKTKTHEEYISKYGEYEYTQYIDKESILQVKQMINYE